MQTENETRPFKVLWTAEAEIDLDRICDGQAAQVSRAFADRVHEEILDRADLIGHFPYSGKRDVILDKIHENVRYVVKHKWRIVYEIWAEEIRIVGVIDMRTNPIKWGI